MMAGPTTIAECVAHINETVACIDAMVKLDAPNADELRIAAIKLVEALDLIDGHQAAKP
jgi:hypothetical protein